MRSFKNIGASDYRRSTNTIAKPGESFTCVSEKEEEIIEAEGAIGIRLEEVFPGEPQVVTEPPAGDLTANSPAVETTPEPKQESVKEPVKEPVIKESQIEVTGQGATRKGSTTTKAASKSSSRR